MIEYHAAFYPIEDGWYFIRVVDFPGVLSQGRNLADARRMIKDALKMMVECYLDEGRPLPRPNRRARDRKAERMEPIRVAVRVQSGAAV